MSESKQLAEFCANLRFEDIPQPVVNRVLELFLDWIGSCLAGSHSRQATVIAKFAQDMGPASGQCKLVGRDQTTSPLFAAMVNGAASHVVEQDDLHNLSVFHPATVVFPAALAVAQWDPDRSGEDFVTAAVAGYESGIRIGEYLGRSHYRVFHTTGTAGTLASAMTVSNLLRLDPTQTLNALGSAGTQAAGLWEFLGDAADSKQLHTAKASSDGLLAAYTAKSGLTGAKKILEGQQGVGAGMLAEGAPEDLVDRLGQRWALMETSFKFHSSCRHTHPAADAMLAICQKHNPDIDEISSVKVHVYSAAKDVLGAVTSPKTIHQSKFSMGFVLALIARYRLAGVSEFTEAALNNQGLMAFHDKVSMQVDPAIDASYPAKWCAKVEVTMNSGERFCEYVDTPKGDPENILSRPELELKAHKLVEFFDVCSAEKLSGHIENTWNLPQLKSVAEAYAGL